VEKCFSACLHGQGVGLQLLRLLLCLLTLEGFAGGRLLGIRVSKDFFVSMESSLGFLFSKSPVRISYL
jgi:hypothetical protein